MAQDSTIRLKQMNQPELSGYVSQVTSGILANSGTPVAATGKLTGAFYPLNSNPKGYAKSGDFVSQIDLDSAIASQNTYANATYYPLSNPSGFMSFGTNDLVYTTGQQEIYGNKTFFDSTRFENNIIGPRSRENSSVWSLNAYGILDLGDFGFGDFTTLGPGYLNIGSVETYASITNNGTITCTRLNSNDIYLDGRSIKDGLGLNSGVSNACLERPQNTVKYVERLTGAYYTGLLEHDFSSVPFQTAIITTLTNGDKGASSQKARIYVKNSGEAPHPSSDRTTIIPIDENSHLEKLRTTSFIGGRFKTFDLERATDINFSFRTHQPITTYIINAGSGLRPKNVRVNFARTKDITIGSICNVRLNFNNTPSGANFSFVSSRMMSNVKTNGGTWVKYLKFVSLSKDGWILYE